MELNPYFWRGRRVLVTGHTGFKGGWLTLWLHSMGAEITGFALAAPEKGFFNAVGLQEMVRSHEGDIREFDLFDSVVRKAQPEVIFHFAAQALVRASYKDPVSTYATNVMGTVHVLEAARRHPCVRSAIIVTSDKCYENREWPWGYREVDRLGGHDPYSSSKACAEIVSAAYRRSYFSAHTGSPAVATVRAGNVIGGGDWSEDRLIPDVLRALAAVQSPTIRNPDAIRPWQHVLEPLRGYMLLAQLLTAEGSNNTQYADAWNFGPDEAAACTVNRVVGTLIRLMGGSVPWVSSKDGGLHEANLLKLDVSKARAKLGWQSTLSIDEALEHTAEWYKHSANNADMRTFSLKQIASYSTRSQAVALSEGMQHE